MISVDQAIENAQSVNRNNFIKHALESIGAYIETASKQGLRRVEIPASVFFLGAENLAEVSEMFQYLNIELASRGFSVSITPNAEIIIEY